MDGERLERLIKLILQTNAEEQEKTKRIEIICAQYKTYLEYRYR